MECKAKRCPKRDAWVIAVVHDRAALARVPVCEMCLASYLHRRDAGENLGVYWLATG